MKYRIGRLQTNKNRQVRKVIVGVGLVIGWRTGRTTDP